MVYIYSAYTQYHSTRRKFAWKRYLAHSSYSEHHMGSIPVLQTGDSDTELSRVVRNLGVLLDCSLTFEDHVNSVCKIARFHLFNIQRIRHLLPLRECEQLVHSFVFSRIDYSNGLLYGLPKKQLHKLQMVLNSAARVIHRVPKRQHITPTLATLHWLPVVARVDFKIALLTYKALHGQAPSYLRELLRAYEPSRPLRSASLDLLCIPPSADSSYQRRAFSYAAPTVWNSLPRHVRAAPSLETFKSCLKTHYFNLHYNTVSN